MKYIVQVCGNDGSGFQINVFDNSKGGNKLGPCVQSEDAGYNRTEAVQRAALIEADIRKGRHWSEPVFKA
jgi:hypothetical protein